MPTRNTFQFPILLWSILPAQPQAAIAPSASVWIAARSGAPSGSIHETAVPSRIYQRARKVWIYTPPVFDVKRKAPYDLLVVFDGAEYLETIPVPRILDNLLGEGRISPTVAILVENGSGAARLGDLANRAQFASFVSDELIPWARENWTVTRDPKRTIITGSSAGGLAAAYIALRRPDLFGNVLAQSPALWRGSEGSNEPPYEWLTAQYKSSPKLPVAFWIEVGSRENAGVLGGTGPVFLDANRRFVDVLKNKGYALQYSEIEGADHEPGHWRDHFADGILWLTARWNVS